VQSGNGQIIITVEGSVAPTSNFMAFMS
jgi:hypothetical protein